MKRLRIVVVLGCLKESEVNWRNCYLSAYSCTAAAAPCRFCGYFYVAKSVTLRINYAQTRRFAAAAAVDDEKKEDHDDRQWREEE